MKKLFALLLVSPLFALVSYTQNLQPFYENGKYGFKAGNQVVIQPKYEYAADFSEGKAAVKLNGKWGFIDQDGKVIIEPKYAKVEKFENNFARFYKAGKFGLLTEEGKEIVGAVCDDAYLSYNGGILISNGKQTWFSDESGKVAYPFKYDKVKFNQYFVECVDSLGTDYYTISGKLVAEHCKPSEMFYYSYNALFLDINTANKAYLVDTSGIQTSDDYYAVDVEFVSYYRSHPEEPGSNLIIRCYLNAETDEMKLMREDGHIFNETFRNWDYVDDALSVENNGTTYQLNDEGLLIAQKYKRVVSLYDHLVLTASNGNQILALPAQNERHLEDFHADTFLIDTFTLIRPLYIGTETESYYDGNYYDASNDRYVQLNSSRIVEVEGLNENKGKYALYDLFLRKIVSPYDQYKKELREDLFDVGIYVYQNQNGHTALSIDGKSTPYKYTIIEKFDYYGYVFTDTLGYSTFFSLSTRKWVDIPGNTLVMNSLNYAMGEPYLHIDEETGEEYYVEPQQRVYRSFPILLENIDNPKIGFIDANARIVKPQFDSIVDDLDFYVQEAPEPIIMMWKNGKCGAYNLDYGWISEPVYDSVLKFNSDQFTRISRAKVPGQPYYISSTGKKFPGTNFEPEFYKENGKMGARDYSYFDDEEKMNVIIPPVYKSLTINYDVPFEIQAQNTEKKYGVLHLETGDTLIPFKYTKVVPKDGYYYSDYTQSSYYEVYDKKLYGLYDMVSLNHIPPVYEDIHSGYGEADAEMVYVHKGGKVGLYSRDLVKFLDCEYDGICVRLINDYILVFAIKGDKVYGFNYMFNSLNNKNPDNNAFDYVVGGIGYHKNPDGYDAFDIASLEYVGSTKTIAILDEENTDFQIAEMNGVLGLKGVETGKMSISGLRLIQYVDGEYVITFEDGTAFYQSLYNKKNKFEASKW